MWCPKVTQLSCRVPGITTNQHLVFDLMYLLMYNNISSRCSRGRWSSLRLRSASLSSYYATATVQSQSYFYDVRLSASLHPNRSRFFQQFDYVL